MAFLFPADHEEVKQELIDQASRNGADHQERQGTTDDASNKPATSEVAEPPKKKAKKEEILARLLGEESDDISSADIAAEVATYLREKPTKANTSPLIWWQGNEDRFPNVAALAKKYLGVPATSTPAERVFSSCGLTVTKLRAALTPSTIDALVFLNRNATSVGIDPAKQLLRQDINSKDPALSACRKVKEEMKEDVNISMPTDGDMEPDDNDLPMLPSLK